jgi:hypothetical protein
MYKYFEGGLKQYAETHNICSNAACRSMLRRIISKNIREIDELYRIEYASEKAVQTAQQMGIDLKKMHWKNQKTFDKNRAVFMFEHKVPVVNLVEKILADPKSVLEVLNSMQIVWILKEEDAVLRSKGHGKNRVNSDASYADAGITLVKIQ